LFDPNPYLPDRVKIEFSVRSQREPNDSRKMQTLLNHYFPNEIYEEEAFLVTTIQPKENQSVRKSNFCMFQSFHLFELVVVKRIPRLSKGSLSNKSCVS
jgi:hypothetical protein